MPEYRYFHIAKTGKLTPKENLSDALTAFSKGGFLWLDYCEPDKADLEALSEPLNLHPLVIEDCVDENQIPKIEEDVRAFHSLDRFISNGGRRFNHHKVLVVDQGLTREG